MDAKLILTKNSIYKGE